MGTIEWALVGVITAQILVFWCIFSRLNLAHKALLETELNVRGLLLFLQDHAIANRPVFSTDRIDAELKTAVKDLTRLNRTFNKAGTQHDRLT